MKKFNLVIAVMLLISASVFAVDVAPTASISGSATATFGSDLQTGATGITTSTSADLDIVFVEKASAEKGEGDVVGYIKIKDFQANADATDDYNLSVGGVEAKLLLGPAYVVISGYGNKLDAAQLGQGATPEVFGVAAKSVTDLSTDPSEESSGIAIGTDLDVVVIELGISSLYDWVESDGSSDTVKLVNAGYSLGTGESFVTGNATTGGVVRTEVADSVDKNDENYYNFHVMIDNKLVDGLTNKVYMNFISSQNALHIGATLGYDLAVGDYTVVADVGVDYYSDAVRPSDNVKDISGLELGAGLGFQVPGSAFDVAESFGRGKYDDDDSDIQPGVAVGLAYGSSASTSGKIETVESNMDMIVTLNTGDLVPVATVVAFVEFGGLAPAKTVDGKDTLTKANGLDELFIETAWGARASADLDAVKPYVEAWGNGRVARSAASKSAAATNLSEDVLKLVIGADIEVIDNTKFTVKWTSSDLADDTAADRVELGVFTFATKISF